MDKLCQAFKFESGKLPLFCSDLGLESECAHKFDSDHVDEFMRAAFTMENAERWGIIDEVPTTTGRGNKAKPFLKIPRMGRHPGNLWVFGFQDFVGAEPIFRSQSTVWLIFRINLQEDADKLYKQLGHPLIKDATLLETGNFIFFKDGQAEVLRLAS
tara:strand:+ start:8049 stop:8519 length:471 start_codon:yes stop_codon:yes gene_type:complete